MGYSPWGHKELEMTKPPTLSLLHFFHYTIYPGLSQTEQDSFINQSARHYVIKISSEQTKYTVLFKFFFFYYKRVLSKTPECKFHAMNGC